ncbi:DUF2158 domain-containing protein [Luteibacter sp. PvP019]|uniref:DUF2158 domain-containing protein n=1 Tax=Luteibacter sp. PvP019 TaxID=3156436 RepID=UPI0033913756
MSEFKAGDVVFHKSGGPALVVVNPAWKAKPDAASKCWCRWWAGSAFAHETFSPAELTPGKS